MKTKNENGDGKPFFSYTVFSTVTYYPRKSTKQF